jgi:hypothetical protein
MNGLLPSTAAIIRKKVNRPWRAFDLHFQETSLPLDTAAAASPYVVSGAPELIVHHPPFFVGIAKTVRIFLEFH